MIGTGRLSRVAFGIWAALILLFLFFPIVIIMLYAFNPSNVQSWPLEGLSTRWFSSTFHNEEVRQALWLSVRAGLLARGDNILRFLRRRRLRRARPNGKREKEGAEDQSQDQFRRVGMHGAAPSLFL